MTFPPRPPQPPIPGRHAIADIRFSHPIFVECDCGFRADGRTAREIEDLWKAHRKEVLVA